MSRIQNESCDASFVTARSLAVPASPPLGFPNPPASRTGGLAVARDGQRVGPEAAGAGAGWGPLVRGGVGGAVSPAALPASIPGPALVQRRACPGARQCQPQPASLIPMGRLASPPPARPFRAHRARDAVSATSLWTNAIASVSVVIPHHRPPLHRDRVPAGWSRCTPTARCSSHGSTSAEKYRVGRGAPCASS